ncbi:hypothetical protein ATJ88_2870 [Isoptericola jiangsuensis]|uniref:Uncharacterized protein n=1 Tax=Isoptericola jiangsuensis TaxID=548579 RepID=A0A2A9F0S2_9MICO|nr:hypothetical protein [Isoptericola jiangsuensis]PFG44152.1 hypothetical protein ATJ88_2870 [Isoptericola jiangsuensis]
MRHRFVSYVAYVDGVRQVRTVARDQRSARTAAGPIVPRAPRVALWDVPSQREGRARGLEPADVVAEHVGPRALPTFSSFTR